MRKGQAEVIVVLGVMLVIILVAYYAIRGGEIVPSPVPKGIYEEQKEVANTVNTMVRSAADLALEDMMAHGGYLEEDVPPDSADFMLTKVPFWVRCDQADVPELPVVKARMENYIEDKVRDGLADVRMLYGDKAEFDASDIQANVDILGDDMFEPDSIEISLIMKTLVRDHAMAADLYPYKVNIGTKFGKIWAFGKDFAESSAVERYFDIFSIESIYMSEVEDSDEGVPKLPTQGVMTACGDVITRNPDQINQYLLEVAGYVMSTVEWWRPMDNFCNADSCMPYSLDMAIQEVNGRAYSDLLPEPKLTDGWVFDLYDFMMATNFKMPRSGPFTIPICTASYNHAYNFSYPFIIRVKDPYTGYVLNFGVETSVKENGDGVMAPASCGFAGASSADCADDKLPCQGGVNVEDDEGMPIEGAWVVYGGCPVNGKTDSSGRAEGRIKCGPENELYVYKNGDYEFLQKGKVSATSLGGPYNVTLNPVIPVTVNFKKIEMSVTGKRFVTGEPGLFDVVTCGACSAHCTVDEKLFSTCLVNYPQNDEWVFADFDNGNGGLPVTNLNMDSMPPGCGESADCDECRERSGELETADATARAEINDACRNCNAECPFTTLASTPVSILPSGYTYAVNANLYHHPDFNTLGVFESAGFTMDSKNNPDVFMNVPMRAEDMNTIYDLEVKEGEKECLKGLMTKCGINPVDHEEPEVSTTFVLEGAQCSCDTLYGIAGSCGEVPSTMFYDCAPGGGSCGGALEPGCVKCCADADKSDVLDYLKSVEESCDTKVICT